MMSLRSEPANNLSELEKSKRSDKFIFTSDHCAVRRRNEHTHAYQDHKMQFICCHCSCCASLSLSPPPTPLLLPSSPFFPHVRCGRVSQPPCPLRLIRTARNNTRGVGGGRKRKGEPNKGGAAFRCAGCRYQITMRRTAR